MIAVHIAWFDAARRFAYTAYGASNLFIAIRVLNAAPYGCPPARNDVWLNDFARNA